MAKSKKDEDPEKDKEDQFDDDEDFGLPDLEYEELDDDDDDETSTVDQETPASEPAKSEEKEVESTDWEQDVSSEEKEEESDESKDDLFYEEESFEEFQDTTVDSTEDTGFGSEPIVDPEITPPPADYVPQYDTDDSSRGKFARVVVMGTLLFAVIAIVFWLVSDNGGTPKETVAEVVEEPPAEVIPTETTPVVEEVVEEPPKNNQANQRTPGEITVLEQRTGKAYIVIGSFFDGDLADDYAKKLSAQGKSPFIIPPFKDYRFHRVAIAEFDSFKDAQSSVEGYKEEFGTEVWPLRY